MQNSWDVLLNKLGIAKTFSDAGQNSKIYTVSDDILLKMVNYLGYKLDKIEDSEQLLAKLEKSRWLYGVEPIYVVRQNEIKFDVVLPAADVEVLELIVAEQNGQDIVVDYTQNVVDERRIGKTEYVRLEIQIDTPMEPNYYEISLMTGLQKYHTILAVTPDKCYVPEQVQNDRIWGFALQLYSLTSERNWGVGDFTDLSNFVRFCKRQGADVIGLNPLNVLFHDFPENASPYSSISRLFLNPIYIDVERVEGFKASFLEGKQEELKRLRQTSDIDYTGVYRLKIEVLEKIFAAIKKVPSIDFKRKFKAFCERKGNDLESLATYQALYSDFCKDCCGGWKAWPREFQNPNSMDVRRFKATHSEQIEFFKFLQFVADEQLSEVNEVVEKSGLKVGLYRDLPVGLCKDSAELWAGNDLFIKECGAGAPPDIFFPKGQKWCLGAFNPYTLKASAYEPFIKILRSAMENAGALRIDHVMSLMRLYIIPDNGEEGTYIYYNFDEMLGIVALESYLQKCMVVGESIGNVPEGFIEKIQERGIYSLSVLWAERWNVCGDFKQPRDFAGNAFCSVGTHDMAPLKMRWFGYDVETMYKLKMINDEERVAQYREREEERRCLLRALDTAGVWPQDKCRQGDCIYGEGYPYGIMEAVIKYVSSSVCPVFLVQLEDIFGVEVLQNLPGTDIDKHPNWRRKLPVKIEDLENNEDFISARKAIAR